MGIVEEAFSRLYPEKDQDSYIFKLSYSGRFSAYNAHVKYIGKSYEFCLSKRWKGVSREIQIGLIQHLMQKVFKTRRKTLYQDLYDSFLKNVHVSIPKDNVDEELKKSFERVNDRYFLGTVEMPNLVYGKSTFRKLGSYEYGSDTITISSVFKNLSSDEEVLLDYIIFHEMLHKVHKYKTTNGRSLHHSKAFKNAEKQFREKDIEKKLSRFLRKKRLKRAFGLD
jgi:predicted metal-dependent hydrolase